MQITYTNENLYRFVIPLFEEMVSICEGKEARPPPPPLSVRPTPPTAPHAQANATHSVLWGGAAEGVRRGSRATPVRCVFAPPPHTSYLRSGSALESFRISQVTN